MGTTEEQSRSADIFHFVCDALGAVGTGLIIAIWFWTLDDDWLYDRGATSSKGEMLKAVAAFAIVLGYFVRFVHGVRLGWPWQQVQDQNDLVDPHRARHAA